MFFDNLTGRNDSHIVQQNGFGLHKDTYLNLEKMRSAALEDGIGISPLSAFRSYSDQLNIWNKKFSGESPIYSSQELQLDYKSLSIGERIHAILQWSALPGASRHHWGTDVDIYDELAEPIPSKIRLSPKEYGKEGVFSKLTKWLNEHMHEFGFFRPYEFYRNGIQAEPWHISYQPIATEALRSLTFEVLKKSVESCNQILGKQEVLLHLESIYDRYVVNICHPDLRSDATTLAQK